MISVRQPGGISTVGAGHGPEWANPQAASGGPGFAIASTRPDRPTLDRLVGAEPATKALTRF